MRPLGQLVEINYLDSLNINSTLRAQSNRAMSGIISGSASSLKCDMLGR